MKFIIEDRVFETLNNMCVAVIIAKGINNQNKINDISTMLKESISNAEKEFENIKVKESEYIKCYRDAFQKLNINPNKFMCSIEALLTRISKKKGMPEINSIVDLVNAVSIKYKLPMGAHDLDSMNNEDFYIRYSVDDDTFLPFGETETEKVDNNELVYAVTHDIRTRRWIWRQSEYGKITENSSNIIFPIDAFIGINDDKAIKARDELAELLANFFHCDIKTGIIDSKNNYIEF
ncbi:tRNA synthetase subunit beta [Brachyspira suanatina]|uniref:tRNA synthetase subunit beta n=1 Tax=Brachyspira suanatina TaxID=381802 RepID=A0A0G4K9K9_9SPIR|nr:phenylalanine--tRNA ligase beta subunit-related protein [Brachyspira suanatina]CRF34495.1 tRNA synthetase subunit beta [Brachyspira suanatina]